MSRVSLSVRRASSSNGVYKGTRLIKVDLSATTRLRLLSVPSGLLVYKPCVEIIQSCNLYIGRTQHSMMPQTSSVAILEPQTQC